MDRSFWLNIYVNKKGETFPGGIMHASREWCALAVIESPVLILNSRVRVTLK